MTYGALVPTTAANVTHRLIPENLATVGNSSMFCT